MKMPLLVCASVVSWTVAVAAPVDRIRNDRVVAQEILLKAGETEPAGGGRPSVVVFLSEGNIELSVERKVAVRAVKRGEVIFRAANGATLRATDTAVRFVRVEVLGNGDEAVWGTTGLAPNYKLVVENRFARVYDIRIPVATSEPQHTHHDRVVVCLSGASLRHEFPDGRQEDSSLATDDCLWRKGSTHVGHNIGTTPLWVIAIEPK